MEAATENNVGEDTEKDRKRKEPVHNQGNVCGQAVHWSGPGLLEYDEGWGEGGAAGAATRTNREGGGRYAVSLGVVLSFVTLSFSLSLSLSLSLSFSLFFSRDRPGGGSGSRREPLADCSRAQRTANGKGLYIISS